MLLLGLGQGFCNELSLGRLSLGRLSLGRLRMSRSRLGRSSLSRALLGTSWWIRAALRGLIGWRLGLNRGWRAAFPLIGKGSYRTIVNRWTWGRR